jgi:hypothetical protein
MTQDELKLLAQLSTATYGGIHDRANQALEAALGTAGMNTLLNQAGPGSAAGSFYDPQQIAATRMMAEPGIFGQPPKTAAQVWKTAQGWAQQGETLTLTQAWLASMATCIAAHQ